MEVSMKILFVVFAFSLIGTAWAKNNDCPSLKEVAEKDVSENISVLLNDIF
jgi:hypothetical protein